MVRLLQDPDANRLEHSVRAYARFGSRLDTHRLHSVRVRGEVWLGARGGVLQKWLSAGRLGPHRLSLSA